MSAQHNVSSPISTGGGGTFFEQHVGAHFLSLLLVRGILPVLKDCVADSVHFQTARLGWHTDDLLVVGTRGTSEKRNLAIQVKRQFTVSPSDDPSRKVFSDFWQDFNNEDVFDSASDRLALVVNRGTNAVLGGLGGLLDTARVSSSNQDFERRLTTAGFLSRKSQQYYDAIKAIIVGVEGEDAVDDDVFWRFLKALHVLSFDLNTATAQTESLVKSLLAFTSESTDPQRAADITWDELLEILSGPDGIPAGTDFLRTDLPESMLSRHAALEPTYIQAAQAIVDHGSIVLQRIRTSIGSGTKLARVRLENKIREGLNERQVVVITGSAGRGKSAVAKQVAKGMSSDWFCLAFQAVEFAKSHINETLLSTQSQLNAEDLFAVLSGQDKKVVLIDGLERLLESSLRDAFSDLLQFAGRDASLKLVLTVRSYSTETVLASLIRPGGLAYTVVEVPPLSDEELEEVVKADPPLERPLSDARLRSLLRSPYILDKASQMDWAEGVELPASYAGFRQKCWDEVVKREGNGPQGISRMRERVFTDVAVRRAEKLKPFVDGSDLDASILESLIRDDVVLTSPLSGELVAPAHDVLEDWAIVLWFNHHFSATEWDLASMARLVEGLPALRRGYKTALEELLEEQPERASSFIVTALRNDNLEQYFRDDTIVCALSSAMAEKFLIQNRETLLENDAQLLIRCIHLLRVACVSSPNWLPANAAISSVDLIPAGEGWKPILQIVSEEIGILRNNHFATIVGLIDDWSRWVSVWLPEPPGFESAGRIAFELLNHLGGYGSNDHRTAVLNVLSRIPSAVPEAFEALIERSKQDEHTDVVAWEFSDLLLTRLDSAFAAKSVPNLLVELAKAKWLLPEQKSEWRDRDVRDDGVSLEPVFGLKSGLDYSFSVPASAFRGPFYHLLRFHPRTGLRFILDLLNHCATWYGEQTVGLNRLEPAREITITLPPGVSVSQWANDRLYQWYRGFSVGPYAVQSALMALEKRLLDECENENTDIDSLLTEILQYSNNVAATAVVASICMAFPDRCPVSSLAIISSPELIGLDRHRYAIELTESGIADWLPTVRAEDEIYKEERRHADSLSHRSRDLESLAIELQLGEQRDAVWQIIDRLREGLPAPADQTAEDRLLRLSLHRMDIRGLRLEEVSGSDVIEASENAESDDHHYYQMIPDTLEADVQEIVDESSTTARWRSDRLSLVTWGRLGWSRREDWESASADWRDKLINARQIDSEDASVELGEDHVTDFTHSGPVLIASICVRDHWDEMDRDNRQWCLSKLTAQVLLRSDSNDPRMTHPKASLEPDQYAAYALARVVADDSIEDIGTIIDAIDVALLHSSPMVSAYAADGVARYLTEARPGLFDRFVGIVALFAEEVQQAEQRESNLLYPDRMEGIDLLRQSRREVLAKIRRTQIEEPKGFDTLDIGVWHGRLCARTLIRLFSYSSEKELSRKLHRQLIKQLIGGWRGLEGTRIRRDYHFEAWAVDKIAKYILTLSPESARVLMTPVTDQIDSNPRECETFLESLINAEDRSAGETPFWDVWQLFADKAVAARWLDRIDNENMSPNGRALVRTLFLGIHWKEGIRHWSRLENHGQRLVDLVTAFPPAAAVLESFCRFLYYIGARSLPAAFVVVQERLASGNPEEILTSSSTRFLLEALLRRYVYGEPGRLKSSEPLRSAVLEILDHLVEAGSSAAYRMRDDFVTPSAPNR